MKRTVPDLLQNLHQLTGEEAQKAVSVTVATINLISEAIEADLSADDRLELIKNHLKDGENQNKTVLARMLPK